MSLNFLTLHQQNCYVEAKGEYLDDEASVVYYMEGDLDDIILTEGDLDNLLYLLRRSRRSV